ncbi:hypothetical protein F4813DRAFT_386056 [Daldinia decipiens]|uniref:uncharacterized protein n=1 Tax=Daldinia decipiens TaxID=326647 RepID=UPI0020C406ED|nr:uncharacterized protein F4813DRAFT_386056 [Daldinia decipiens]KAI1661526.1 hypothetical protein F4813DRAFT_386056 [Daldinia decipiens]
MTIQGEKGATSSRLEAEDMPGPSNIASEKSPLGLKGRTMPENPESMAESMLHIFSCLAGVIHPGSDAIDEEALYNHLEEVDDYLLSRTSFSDRRAYSTCHEATYDEIYGDLEQEGVELSKPTDGQHERQHDYEERLDIFNAANAILNFFFPPNVEVPTIRKFWGALKFIVIDSRTNTYKSTSKIRRKLRDLCVDLRTFNEIFTQSGRQEQAKIMVPKEIFEGWIHLLIGLIYLLTDYDKASHLLDGARFLIYRGMVTMVRLLSKRPLLDNSVVLPLELLSLLCMKLLQGVTVGTPNINEHYSDCLDIIEVDIASKPSDRSLEYHLSRLEEEISAIDRVVVAQESVFQSLRSFTQEMSRGERLFEPNRENYSMQAYESDPTYRPKESSEGYYTQRPSRRSQQTRSRSKLRRYYDRVTSRTPRNHDSYETAAPGYIHETQRYYDPVLIYDAEDLPTDFKLASTDQGGYRILFLNECCWLLDGRKDEFNNLKYRVFSLKRTNRNKIDTTKDRHDNAIYAFTIVTIIFLPLSAVASIFGMNTRDVRDMDLDQWAYWATSVPVTVVVIFLGLLWTGELGNLVYWIQSFSSHQQDSQPPSDSENDEIFRRRSPPSPSMYRYYE